MMDENSDQKRPYLDVSFLYFGRSGLGCLAVYGMVRRIRGLGMFCYRVVLDCFVVSWFVVFSLILECFFV